MPVIRRIARTSRQPEAGQSPLPPLAVDQLAQAQEHILAITSLSREIETTGLSQSSAFQRPRKATLHVPRVSPACDGMFRPGIYGSLFAGGSASLESYNTLQTLVSPIRATTPLSREPWIQTSLTRLRLRFDKAIGYLTLRVRGDLFDHPPSDTWYGRGSTYFFLRLPSSLRGAKYTSRSNIIMKKTK